MKNLLKNINQRPIAYYPIYRQITGSTTAGILLSQLMYWFSKKDKFHKTDNDIMQETFLSKKELENAKKLIKRLDFITVTREGLPAKTFYEIDWEKYETSLSLLGDTVSTNGGNTTPPMGETLYKDTKTTTKTTTNIKNKKKENQTEILPPELNVEAFKMWCEYKGKNYSKQGKTLSINKLIKYPQEIQMQMVENSIMNNYKGLFEIKPQGNQVAQYQQPQQTIDPFALYTDYRNKGMTREVATVRVIQETNMKYPATEDFKKAVADAEYEWYMVQKAQQPKKESDEEYIKRVMGEL